MRDALANFATPFPEEAIGIGARWEVRQPIQSQGMKINQAATYELASLEGDLASLDSEMPMSINLGSQKQPLAVKTKMNLRVQTR